MALSGRTEVLSNGNETRHYRIGYEPEVWRRKKLLGAGGFGQVWQENLVSGFSQIKVRAVKTISKSTSSEQHLRQELEIILTFSDMNKDVYRDSFVGCYCWFQDAMNIYIAMECFPHGDLQSFIDGAEGKKKPVAEAEAAMIVAQVARALHHMHDKGVVHRDLKPQNILVDTPGPNWHVKLTDFGVSKSMQSTILDTAVGTNVYKAPELYDIPESGPYDGYTAAVDIWSLGAVAFCVRTGRPPFRSAGDIFKFKYDQMEFPTDQLRASTIRCMEFVLSTIEKIPDKRPNIRQVLELEWIRPATSNATTNPSSLQVEKFEDEASASWGSLANSSGKDANDSTFTVRPFMGKEPGSMSNHMSSRATRVEQLDPDTIKPLPNPSSNNRSISIPAPVLDPEVVALPFRPTQPQQPSPIPVIGAGYRPPVQMTRDVTTRASPVSSSPDPTSKPPRFQNYSNTRTDTVLTAASLEPPHSGLDSEDKGSHPPVRPPTPPKSWTQIHRDSLSNIVHPVSSNQGIIQPRPEPQSRSDSGYQTAASSSVSRTKVTPSQVPKEPWSKYLNADPRLTCLSCGKNFEIRDDLYDHLEEEEHAVDLATKVPESYVRPERSRQWQSDQNQRRAMRESSRVTDSSSSGDSSARGPNRERNNSRPRGYAGGGGYRDPGGYASSGGGYYPPNQYQSGRGYPSGETHWNGGYYPPNGYQSGRGYPSGETHWNGGPYSNGSSGLVYSPRGYLSSSALPKKKKSKWYKRLLNKS